MYYFISYLLFDVPEHKIPLKQLSIADFAIVAKDSLFWFSIVTSPQLICDCECRTLALWRHIRWLFLHVQIGAKVIFTSE